MKRTVMEVHEEMMKYGAESQGLKQLLEIIIGDADKANAIAEENQIYSELARNDYSSLLNAGLTKQEAQRLAAAIQLGKQIAESNSHRDHITTPGDAAMHLMPKMRHDTHERFVVLLLNTKNRIIKEMQISEGSLTSAVVHPREVFAPAVTNHAASILIAHNHPSGDPYPSSEDRNLTTAIDDAGNILGIPLLDHVIIGDGRYYSFKEHGDI